MKNAIATRTRKRASRARDSLNVVDVLLGPTLRDEMEIIDRFVFRLRAWEPRMALAFTALPGRPDGGLRILNSGQPWNEADLELLETRVQGLAREFRIAATTQRRAVLDASDRPVWDVSWVDERLRELDEEAVHAHERVEQRLAEIDRERTGNCAKIAEFLSLYKYGWIDDGREDYVVAGSDSPSVRDIACWKREVPDFYTDTAAFNALVKSVVGSGLSLSAHASIAGDLTMLWWKCTIADWRPRCSGVGGVFSGEGLDLASAVCAACIAYLDGV